MKASSHMKKQASTHTSAARPPRQASNQEAVRRPASQTSCRPSLGPANQPDSQLHACTSLSLSLSLALEFSEDIGREEGIQGRWLLNTWKTVARKQAGCRPANFSPSPGPTAQPPGQAATQLACQPTRQPATHPESINALPASYHPRHYLTHSPGSLSEASGGYWAADMPVGTGCDMMGSRRAGDPPSHADKQASRQAGVQATARWPR